MANYQGVAKFEVLNIINLNIDVKNQVFSEVIEPVETGRKQFTQKKFKKFNELIEFWGKIKAHYNN